jgi:hypothetical protein
VVSTGITVPPSVQPMRTGCSMTSRRGSVLVPDVVVTVWGPRLLNHDAAADFDLRDPSRRPAALASTESESSA